MFNSSIMKDVVSLVKPNGDRYDNIQACVTPNAILIGDTSLPIEEGDKISRILPNRTVENYIVLDRGFITGSEIIESHFDVKVEKENTLKNTNINHFENNFYGTMFNSQIQQNSKDSTQTMNITESYSQKEELKVWLDGILNQNLPSISLEQDKLDTIEKALKNINAELERSNSKPGIIKDGLSSIRTVLEGAAANLVASGLLYQLSQFQ